MRDGNQCKCDDGWTGINCNVCTEDKACDALMETGDGGVCYANGEVINHNYQICDVTNKKITDLLGKQRPEVTSLARPINPPAISNVRSALIYGIIHTNMHC